MRRFLSACAAPFLLSLGICGDASAQEVSLYAGGLDAPSIGQSTYSYAFEYRQGLTGPFAASFTWLNEGHVTDHHRDGQGAQLWWRNAPDNSLGLVLSLGLGPYAWYDTTRDAPDSHFLDAHGWGVLGSADATWYFQNGWLASLRLNTVAAHRDFDTVAVVAGVGYRFDTSNLSSGRSGNEVWNTPWHWELQGFAGQATANTFHSQTGAVEMLGVRTDINEHIGASFDYLSTDLRNLGFSGATAAECWLGTPLTANTRVELGVGALFPVDIENRNGHSGSSDPAALIAIAGAYSLTPKWVLRVVWDRVGTGDSHDADLLLFGAGYRF